MAIIEALQQLNFKAIVVGQCFPDSVLKLLRNEWRELKIVAVASAPYPWLVP